MQIADTLHALKDWLAHSIDNGIWRISVIACCVDRVSLSQIMAPYETLGAKLPRSPPYDVA